jgi:hypothetical protein
MFPTPKEKNLLRADALGMISDEEHTRITLAFATL